MTEYVYKLNLPPITEVLTAEFQKEIFTERIMPIHQIYRATKTVNSNWLKFNNIPWTEIVVFFKYNLAGKMHVDDDKITSIEEPCKWSINWIHQGSGLLEFWEKEDVKIVNVRDLAGQYHISGMTDLPARKSYITEENAAYLVNVSMLHKATGYGPRYSVGLRSRVTNFLWSEVVDKFSNYIVDGAPNKN